MSPSLSSLSQMEGWATGPTAFKASSQEQKRNLLFLAENTDLDDFFTPSNSGHFLPNSLGYPGVPYFLICRQVYQHTMVFSKYMRYLRVFFPQSRP